MVTDRDARDLFFLVPGDHRDAIYLYVSRPSFADMVAIHVLTGDLVWRTPIDGYRADHSAISPDGKVFLVSASTAGKVQAIDTATDAIVGEFESSDQPHESNYSQDGQRIYHASIGKVYVPTTSKLFDWIKGERVFQVVDAESFEVLRRVDMGEKLELVEVRHDIEALEDPETRLVEDVGGSVPVVADHHDIAERRRTGRQTDRPQVRRRPPRIVLG